MRAGRVRCCVTSPPYWGLRDYGVEGQIGLEPTPDEYVGNLVDVFREVRRVLRDDGTLWINLGDTYARSDKKGGSGFGGKNQRYLGDNYERACAAVPPGLKPKDLVGIPWRVAFALQADGWYLRSDIIWAKPNPMPESVRDRPTKAHEYVFLLTKSRRYYYDWTAVREKAVASHDSGNGFARAHRISVGGRGNKAAWTRDGSGLRNRRSVWNIPTRPFPEAHFAVMPEALAEPCIRAGSDVGDTVIDPFAGAGTVALVSRNLGRHFVGIELNPEYCTLIRRRLQK